MTNDDGPNPEPLNPRRVLLVDDHRELRVGIAKYLGFQGFEVVEADGGRAAIDAVTAGPPFRFLLTDLSLPDIDGREVAAEVRRISPATWIAIITGWDVEADELGKWGVDEVFPKPVDLALLSQRIRDVGSSTP